MLPLLWGDSQSLLLCSNLSPILAIKVIFYKKDRKSSLLNQDQLIKALPFLTSKLISNNKIKLTKMS
ncbi:MAG: hypothetical protein ACK55Z_36590 [bacterium]